jgi:hypothetical protein
MKGNPNPSPATRFGAPNGNTPGRKHTKDKLSQAFLKDLQETWEKHGREVLERMAAEGNPQGNAALAKIAASLEPKELEITRPLDGVSDEELGDLIDILRARKDQPTVN